MNENVTFETILMSKDIAAITDFIQTNDENLLTYLYDVLRKIEKPGDQYHNVFQIFIGNQKKYLTDMNSETNKFLLHFIYRIDTGDHYISIQKKIAIDSILDAGANPFFDDEQFHSIFSAAVAYERPYIYKKIIDDNIIEDCRIENLKEWIFDEGKLDDVMNYHLIVRERRNLEANLISSKIQKVVKV